MRHLCFILALGLSLTVLPNPASASVAADVQQWLSLRDPSRLYSFDLYARFLKNHSDWPETLILRQQAERNLCTGTPDMARAKAFFDRHPPVTDDGRLLYIRALVNSNDEGRAMALLRASWETGSFSASQQDFIRARWGGNLSAESDKKRLDHLLWQSNLGRAEKALEYVDTTTRKIGQTRISLQRSDSRAEQTALNLIAQNTDNSGLYFDLARFYRGRERDGQAVAILAKFRGEKTGMDSAWWRERHLLARRALERKNYQRAYNLAAAHGLKNPPELAEAEWFAGWIAVTRLKQPSLALKHFERMYHNVKTPISIARAAYWAGIAASQSKNPALATEWYGLAARHPHVFYGQMAAYALGDPNKSYAAFFNRHDPAPQNVALRTDMVDAARFLNSIGKTKERDAFLHAVLNDAIKKEAPWSVIPVAQSLNSNKIKLLAAKAAYEKNILVRDALFPMLRVPLQGDVENALTLGVIRQESQFDTHAQSPAGARGLMQLMPATAKQTAREASVPYNNQNQLFQPNTNMMLGQAYMEKLLVRYDYFVPLAVAAYNAGPRNVDKWLVENGDPRANPAGWVDWAERIPFYETRNYVQRVWESYSFYKALNSKKE